MEEPKQPDKCWKSGVKTLEKCGLHEENEVTVWLDSDVDIKINTMSQTIGNIEWLGFLVGVKCDNGDYVVSDIRVPKQTVTSASVEVDEPDTGADVVGTVHSHHTMGSFHSGTDDEYLVGNHDLTLVWSNSGEYATKVRIKLPCGHYIAQKAKVVVEAPVPDDLEDFIKDSVAKVTERKYSYQTYLPDPRTPAYGHRLCTACHTVIAYQYGAWWKGDIYHLDCLPKEGIKDAFLELAAEDAIPCY